MMLLLVLQLSHHNQITKQLPTDVGHRCGCCWRCICGAIPLSGKQQLHRVACCYSSAGAVVLLSYTPAIWPANWPDTAAAFHI
jgi:hypothetical protein